MGDNKYFKDLGYRVTSPYDWRTIKKNGKVVKEFHCGVDLVWKKPQGELASFTDGEVIFAGEAITGSGYGGFGNAVAIKDKNGAVHVYGHVLKVLVKKGDKVKKGQPICIQGNKGISVGVAHDGYLAGEHLHYEIRKSATYVEDREKRCYVPDEYLIKFFGSEVEMKAETANEIIAYLSNAWKKAKDEKEQDKIHDLANELRKISGQEVK
jgi:murein DD-endopeptidase MepM/ murein hydrolase activator NlpD